MTGLYFQCINLFAGLLIVHWYLLRFWGSELYVARALKVYVGFFIVWNLISRMGFQQRLVVVTTVGLFWAFKMVVMVNLMNSVSIQMVRALNETELGMMPREEFFALFSADELLEHRIQILLQNGLISKTTSGTLGLTKKGRIFGQFFGGIQKVFRITQVG